MAGLGTGLYYARRLYRRADELRAWVVFCRLLADRLAYTAAPLADLWLSLSEERPGASLPLVQSVAAALRRDEPFSAVFIAAVDAAAVEDALRQALRTLGSALGRSGLEQQIGHIRHCQATLETLHEAALAQAAVRAPVYRMTGFAGGVSLALLLM